MIDESCQDWINRVVSNSKSQIEQYLSYSKRDVDDWEGKAWAFYNNREDEDYSGILFEGKRGTGKHTALSAFLNVYAGNDGLGYQAFILDSLVLPDGLSEYSMFEKHVNELVKTQLSEHSNILIIIEDIEDNKCSKLVLKHLPILAQNYSSDDSDIVYFVVSNSFIDVPSIFAKTTCKFVFDNTFAEQRKRYIERYFPSYSNFTNIEQISRLIGDCLYCELVDIIRVLSLEEISGITLNEEIVRAASDKYSISKLIKNKPHSSFDLFFERLEKVLSGTSFQSVDSSQNENNNPVDTNNNSDTKDSFVSQSDSFNPTDHYINRRKELEQMAPHNLMVGLFGEEGVQEIVNTIST